MKKTYPLILIMLCFAFQAVSAQDKILYNFSGNDGNTPNGDLVLSGNKLYGMTPMGGANNEGCIFSINTNGTGYKDIFDFNGTNGANPYGSLTISGNSLYGMTSAGGSQGFGVVFSIDTNGSGYNDLLDFNTGNAIGKSPFGSLILSGNRLFGMTENGGTDAWGCIFSINNNGSRYKEILDFTGVGGAAQGGAPRGSLILSGSTLYGMNYTGGISGGNNGDVFSVDTNGSGYKDLLDFNITNGAQPYGSLTLSGNTLFGMTFNGGANGDGCLFSVGTNGTGYKDLLDLGGATTTKGRNPEGSLILSGNTLLGMTQLGGANGTGCIFSINTGGSGYTDLYDFNFTPDGNNPYGSLILSGNTLYGMTSTGGANGDGVVFSFTDITIGINELSANSNAVKLFPNPNNGNFNIEFKSEALINSTIEVYNLLGEKTFTTKVSSTNTQIDLSNYTSGVYLYRVYSDTGHLNSEGKFIIQK